MAQQPGIIKYGKDLARDIADFIFTKSQENLIEMKAIDQSDLFLSGDVFDEEDGSVIEYSAPHACVIGSRGSIVKIEKGHQHINAVTDDVLSKDGKYHKVKVIDSGRFSSKPNGILLRSKKQRGNGLFVTSDHLVATVRNDLVVWENAKNLKVGDYVFRPKKLAWNKGNRKYSCFCEVCGKEKIDTNKRKFCSTKCYHKSKTGKASPLKGTKWKRRRTFLERLRFSGKNNPAWKGGVSKLPYSIGWTKILKEKVKMRDNYTCQECFLEQKDSNWSFHVHHKDGDKFNNSMKNLITLCSSCHGKEQWRDCELIDIDLSIFEPVELIEVKKINPVSKKGSLKKTKLWDLSVDGENSFVCNGILIHNSAVNDGTDPHFIDPEELEGWVRRKLNPGSDKKVKEIAFFVSRSIKKFGTIPRPFFTKALAAAESKFGIKTEPL